MSRPIPPTGAAPPVGVAPEVTQRRTLRVLVLSQVFAGLGIGGGVAVGSLLAEDLLGTTSLAGLPSALFALGGAVAALGVGRLSDRAGRRGGLAAGYAVAAVGSVAVVAAAVLTLPLLLILGLFLYGAGNATNLQARYAGTDLAPAARRGRAVSTVLVATTLGAVVGPNLVAAMGRFAEAAGVPTLAGPFILAAAAYSVAGTLLHHLLRPDPLLTARALHLRSPAASDPARLAADAAPVRWTGALRLGALTMIVTQLVMTAIMTMTPIHMRDEGHGLSATGLVISLHVAGMYLPSPITGWLADRYGRHPVIMLAGVVLLIAGVFAALAPGDSVPALAVALILLGFGWNLGLISGTTLVADGTPGTPLAARARTQGSVDLAVALAGSGGGIVSGLVVDATGFATMAVAGGLLALMLVPLMLRGGAALRPAT